MSNPVSKNNQVFEKNQNPLVGIIMGSQSDLGIMGEAARILEAFEIPYEIKVVSAHRTPKRLFTYGETAKARGLKVIIAGAGGAAHLPGMMASITTLPVIGVPVKLKALEGMDSLLSIVQMPGGIPVATVGVDNAKNGGLLAIRILAAFDEILADKLENYQQGITEGVVYDLESYMGD